MKTKTTLFHGGILMPCLFLLLLAPGQAQNSLSRMSYTYCQDNIPAARCLLPHSFAHASFRNDFCTKEMMYKELEISLIHNQDALLTSFTHYGYGLFGELQAHIGYGRRFGKHVGVALRGVYLLNHAHHHAARHSVTIDFSLCCKINNTLAIGVALYNPIRMKYGVIGQEVIPMSFNLQVCYLPVEKLNCTAFAEKRVPGGFDLGAKIFYHPISYLILSGTASLSHCGIGVFVPWKSFVFSLQSQWYYRVSFSPQCAMDYYFKNR